VRPGLVWQMRNATAKDGRTQGYHHGNRVRSIAPCGTYRGVANPATRAITPTQVDSARLFCAALSGQKVHRDYGRYHTLLEKGNEIEAPTLGLQGAMPAINRLAYFARELASFASYTLALFSQNELVAGS